jgi:PilZ domain
MSSRDHTFQNKRKSSRYSVTGSSAVMLPLINVISYRVLDISKTGLSFCYNGKASKSEGSNMAMTFFSAVMNAIDIPVQVICDTELNINHLLPYQFVSGDFRNPHMRRCGVKFNQLSFEQEEAIKLYIQHIEETTDTTPKSV